MKSICPPMPGVDPVPERISATCPVRSISNAELIATTLSFWRMRAVSFVRSEDEIPQYGCHEQNQTGAWSR